MSNEKFAFGSDGRISNVRGSDCYICHNHTALWRNSVQEVYLCFGKGSKIDHMVQKYWSEQNAVTACKNGHLFDKICLDRYEETHALLNNGAPLHCPLCKNNEFVWEKSKRKIFNPQITTSTIAKQNPKSPVVSFTTFRKSESGFTPEKHDLPGIRQHIVGNTRDNQHQRNPGTRQANGQSTSINSGNLHTSPSKQPTSFQEKHPSRVQTNTSTYLNNAQRQPVYQPLGRPVYQPLGRPY